MNRQDNFEIRLSRLITIPLFLAGLVFLLPGLDMLAFHLLFPRPPQGMAIPYYILALLFTLMGGSITVKMSKTIMTPPILLRLTPSEISFPKGLYSYELYRMQWNQYEKAEYGLKYKILSLIPVSFAGLVVKIRPTGDQHITTNRWTDMGISYEAPTLCINRWCMDRPIGQAMAAIGRFASLTTGTSGPQHMRQA